MKANQRNLILVCLALAVGLSAYHSLRTSRQRREVSSPDTASVVDGPPRDGSGPAAGRERPVAKGGAAAAGADDSVPEGIDAEAWKSASQMFEMMKVATGESMVMGALMKQKEIDQLMEVLGLDAAAGEALRGKIDARNEKLKEMGEELLAKMKENPRERKEQLALAMTSKEKVTPEMEKRRAELRAHDEAQEKDYEPARQAWFQDDGFVQAMRGDLSAEKAGELDGLVTNEKQKRVEMQAYYTSKSVAAKLELDEDQKKQLFELYKTNPKPANEELMPLLNDAQREKLKADPKLTEW
ncbi:MAG: hypothetical protein JWO82_2416 [Akkermansiaceae bacterium]|nr:hypothetical protein [Akkermansiaceae bacterium]